MAEPERYKYVEDYSPPAPFGYISLAQPQEDGPVMEDVPAQIDSASDYTILPQSLIEQLRLVRLGQVSDAVRLLYAGEKVRPDDISPSATIGEVDHADDYDVLTLHALVQMKLTSFRRKDQVHLPDLLDIGLVDATWLSSLLPEHAERLQQLIDTPDG